MRYGADENDTPHSALYFDGCIFAAVGDVVVPYACR